MRAGSGSDTGKRQRREAHSAAFGAEREKHRHALLVVAILLAEMGDQIALFEEDADQDIKSVADGEDEMTHAHLRRRPESDDKTQIKGMAHELIEHGRVELGFGDAASEQRRKCLSEAKEFEMIDEESGGQKHA